MCIPPYVFSLKKPCRIRQGLDIFITSMQTIDLLTIPLGACCLAGITVPSLRLFAYFYHNSPIFVNILTNMGKSIFTLSAGDMLFPSCGTEFPVCLDYQYRGCSECQKIRYGHGVQYPVKAEEYRKQQRKAHTKHDLSNH